MMLEDSEAVERAARWEIVRYLRKRSDRFRQMELSEADIEETLERYIDGENVHETKLNRVARDFWFRLNHEDKGVERYLPKRKRGGESDE